MKMIIAFAALVAVAIAAPIEPEAVLVSEIPSDNNGLGGYHFGYVRSDGVTRDESAQLIGDGPDAYLAVVGSFTVIDPETNQPTVTKYVADKDGYRVEGDHIPA